MNRSLEELTDTPSRLEQGAQLSAEIVVFLEFLDEIKRRGELDRASHQHHFDEYCEWLARAESGSLTRDEVQACRASMKTLLQHLLELAEVTDATQLF